MWYDDEVVVERRVICHFCGAIVDVNPYHRDDFHYCSVECWVAERSGLWLKITAALAR